eukprot:TRINITY_DN923_c0_g2_i1.p1 TRINITY_DN923_c0_g2~~TRINITY_DN923_c0_g2_i1.p1  ORF type:complete len:546 (-),score=186.52 TRINITY_DN923_c0_g2_i1:259-1896(-)
MKGWFDGFRENGGPTMYAYSNRTSVYGDLSTITVYIVFITLFLAFFVIFPGIRKERFTTFTSVTLSLFVGTVILIGNNGSSWHVAQADITSAYRSFSNDKIMGKIGVYIGLVHSNVTLSARPSANSSGLLDINFNERFTFAGAQELKEGYRAALVKGLPFPILTVAEYLAVDAEGFCWGRSYREAGYYTSIALWVSFAAWSIMNVLFVVVPRYGAYSMTVTGLLMLLSDAIYVWLLPRRPLRIQIEGSTLEFEFGWAFWIVLIAGLLCFLVGFSISIIDLLYPHKFSTVLEMDYGTPFDRHTIIEDSNETKKKKKVLPKSMEEPSNSVVGLGGLLRRFSKRDRDHHHQQQHMHPGGEDNYTFEMDAPKSPWRYPHLIFRNDSRKHNKQVSFKQVRDDLGPLGHLRRADSKDSSISSLSSAPHQNVGHSLSVPASVFNQRFRRTDSADSNNSSLASFSLSLLSRTNSRKKAVSPGGAPMSLPMDKEEADISVISRGKIFHPSDESSGSRKSSNNDEVAIVVTNRKNSVTKAIRRNSSEQKPENGSW